MPAYSSAAAAVAEETTTVGGSCNGADKERRLLAARAGKLEDEDVDVRIGPAAAASLRREGPRGCTVSGDKGRATANVEKEPALADKDDARAAGVRAADMLSAGPQ